MTTPLFIKKQDGKLTIAALYVDDMILTGTDPQSVAELKQHLHKIFGIKDLGKPHYFLRFEVSYTDEGVILS